MKCPNSFYDSRREMCDASLSAEDVKLPKCPKDHLESPWLEYKRNPVYFIFCQYGDEKTVYRCADAEIFNLKRNDCVHECKKRGIFPDRRNCNHYYTCSSEGSVAKRFKCPKGYYFLISRCVHEISKCIPEIRMGLPAAVRSGNSDKVPEVATTINVFRY